MRTDVWWIAEGVFLIKNQTDDVTRVIWLAGWSSEFQRGGSSKNTTRPKSIQAARHSISACAALMSECIKNTALVLHHILCYSSTLIPTVPLWCALRPVLLVGHFHVQYLYFNWISITSIKHWLLTLMLCHHTFYSSVHLKARHVVRSTLQW